MISKIKKKVVHFIQFVTRENIHRLLLILFLLLVFSTIGLVLVEDGITLGNAFWWSIVTMTTVGYGDITPVTIVGRVIGAIIMLLGIGILGMFTATVASAFVEKKIKENRGMNSFDFEEHIIICEWNYRSKEILKELRADKRFANAPVVLIAGIDEKPIDDQNLFFIQGDVNEENLSRANIGKAKTVVILGNDTLAANARDAQVVLATLTVESINPDVYSIVELVDENNVRHCQRAKADEIIVGSEFSSRLISRSTMNHGISRVFSELLSSHYGNDIYHVPIQKSMEGEKFIEVFAEMKRTKNSIVLAIYKDDQKIISNPPGDYRIENGDHLVIISNGRPDMLE